MDYKGQFERFDRCIRNLKVAVTVIVLVVLASVVIADTSVKYAQLKMQDLVQLKVGNYVHGFKEFDTSVIVVGETVMVGIYWDKTTQSRNRAQQLQKRYEDQLPPILKNCGAADYSVVVSVYSEDRTGRGY